MLGLNLGKSKATPLELAADDYASSLELLAPLADYAVINVSSPNTPGLRELQGEAPLRRLVERLRRLPACPPLLVKIAPDLEDEAIDGIARLAYEEGLAGVIAVNTSLDRFGLERTPPGPDWPHPGRGRGRPQWGAPAPPGPGGDAAAAGDRGPGPAPDRRRGH